MPKLVDHSARRRDLARVHQLEVARRGFGATTYARLAAAAGVSVGTLQHYFDDRAELVRFSFEDLLATRDARVSQVVDAGESAGQSIRTMVLTAARELLPLDDDRRREHSVGQQLRAETWRDPFLRTLAVEADGRLLTRLRMAVVAGKECGEVDADIDADVAARRILAAVQGLADGLSLHDDFSDRHDEVLEPVVLTVFSGRCRRWSDA